MDIKILELIEKYPNDSDLGKKVREMYYQHRCQINMVFEQMEMIKNNKL
jgi:hypothetical protein